MKNLWIILCLVILGACTTFKRVPIEEDKLFRTRRYVGLYEDYRFVKPRFVDPNTCWVKTSLDSIYGKIPVAGKEIKYDKGEPIFIRRTYIVMAGNAGGFWAYQMESGMSKYTYVIRGNKAGSVVYEDIFEYE